jgi:hypothetical protein
MRRFPRSPFMLGGAPVVTDEMREAALVKTTEIMGKLDQIRKRLELPADQLDLVADTYVGIVSSIAQDEANKELEREQLLLQQQWGSMVGQHGHGGHTHNFAGGVAQIVPAAGSLGGEYMPIAARGVLPLKSKDKSNHPYKVKPGEVFDVIARPQRLAFRVEEIEIHDHPDRWIVVDIKVGNRSQFSQAGEIPGSMFARDGAAKRFQCETAQTAMDVMMTVRYIGSERDGEVFSATAVGTEAR